MVNFTLDQIREIMNFHSQIRNITVIAHVDHGKTTLTDSLIAKAGIIASKVAGEAAFLDSEKLEIEKGITIKSTSVSMHFELPIENTLRPFLINLIDSPGHVDFSSEVTSALRVSDGALVVVDAVEGVCVQTETVLRQALQEKVKPILMINKIDRLINELQLGAEEIYLRFAKIIDSVNAIICTYEFPDVGDLTVDPALGNVAFGSGKGCWAFTIKTFAKKLAQTHKKEGLLMKKLWGDNFFNPETNSWSENKENGNFRGFNFFILENILKFQAAVSSGDESSFLEKLSLKLPSDVEKLDSRKKIQYLMSQWLNAADNLLEMIILHLPSPVEAQKYRVNILYSGPSDDEFAEAIRNCDPNGPLMMYVSKMVPTQDKTRFYAFGRVFSGTIASGQNVRILGPNYQLGSNVDLFKKSIQRTVLMMGRYVEAIPDVPAGNVVGIVGIDEFLKKCGTVTSHSDAFPFFSMKFSVSPVVRVSISPVNPAETAKLVEGLKRLSQYDQLLQVFYEETGEIVLGCSGELHAEICLETLRSEFTKVKFNVSDPIVQYRETITKKTEQECLVKSANKLNRFYFEAEPLDSELCSKIESREVSNDPNLARKILVENFSWDKQDANKLWCFGPDIEGTNALVDKTVGQQYLHEVKDSIVSGFNWATKKGALVEEEMRGVRVNIVEALLHTDNAHRGTGEILPAVRKGVLGSQLCAEPRLQEPIFLCEIKAPQLATNGVYKCLGKRRAEIVDELPDPNSSMSTIMAYLPVAESFGFVAHLREATSGMAFPQCVFDHWKTLECDPLEAGSKANLLVKGIRKRKGLAEEIHSASYYLDKL